MTWCTVACDIGSSHRLVTLRLKLQAGWAIPPRSVPSEPPVQVTLRHKRKIENDSDPGKTGRERKGSLYPRPDVFLPLT